MATRSVIGIENNDGTISAIYCHWDGYVSGVGKQLVTGFCSRTMVEGLIAHGDVSSLGTDLATTKFYHRDMGECLSKSRRVKGAAGLESFMGDCGAGFAYYITRRGKWKFSAGDGFQYLEPAVKKECKSTVK